jgi:hypothetical protein
MLKKSILSLSELVTGGLVLLALVAAIGFAA